MEVAVALGTLEDDVGAQQRQNATEALAGNEHLGGHNPVAQTDGLAEQLAVEVDVEQSAGGGVARVEQADVDLRVGAPEVIAQYAVVEQQLHVVLLLLQAGARRLGVALEVVVLARLLLHQQSHVAGHQVDTPLQAQPFADERRLEQRLLAVVVLAEECLDGLADVCRLLAGIVDKPLGVEVVAGGELQRLLAEEAVHRVGQRCLAVVDDVVECRPGKVTQEHRLRVAAGPEPFGGVEERVVPVAALEAVGQRRDVKQEVGLYHHQAGLHTLSLRVTVEQVQLHPLAQHLAQVLMLRIVHLDVPAVGSVGPDGLPVEAADHTTYIAGIDGRQGLSADRLKRQ